MSLILGHAEDTRAFYNPLYYAWPGPDDALATERPFAFLVREDNYATKTRDY
jgi:hypothetical protein